ncbi:hypothetical protein IVA78_00855 [Bradyrhizobium sp. 137]|uniref:hypothetical protein n=1 Tax=Bradyrhizobium sp. 137 TaxID=2782614 RepID=UPI001FF8C31D|nr:hypothetical protein [Bradyrhizobium sp. 137]MCK1753808.1 hypothetical protein [Bradyrhizobium sp. 137]
MSKTITATAVIQASDKTGSTLDKIASKFKSVEKNAKALEGIKPLKFTGDMFEELKSLQLSEKQLQGVRKEFALFNDTLKQSRPKADHYFRAIHEWQGKTVDHWRNIKAGVDDAEKAHKRFFASAASSAARFGLHAAGLVGGAYMAGHAVRATVKTAGAQNRAAVRYEQMGLSDSQLGEANILADSLSARYPTISRADVLDDLRKNASRLGSFDRAKEIADTYARARISNRISGGDEHELEQVVRALEGAGKANSAAEFASGMNMWSKAKAANPDYTGEQFRSDLSAASSAKYGLSKDYMENVFPILASHTSGFGNKLATGLSALVGGRMTKKVKGELTESGLLKNGKLVDTEGYISNNYEWTQKHIKPLLEKQGVHFGEHMSEEDKGKTVKWLQSHFSARNAADLMATNLIDESLVERARGRKTTGLEGVPDLQAKDAALALEGLKTQALDLGGAFMGLETITSAMNTVAGDFANYATFTRTGKMPESSPGLHAIQNWWNTPTDERNRRENMEAQRRDLDSKLDSWAIGDEAKGRLRIRQFDLQRAIDQSNDLATMPPVVTKEELAAAAKRTGLGGGGPTIPMPNADPRKSAMPPVQSLEGANVQATLTGSAEVHGEVKNIIEVKASQYFEALVQGAQNAIKLVGQYTANGVGSTGKSSPDAAAPAAPHVGSAGNSPL